MAKSLPTAVYCPPLLPLRLPCMLWTPLFLKRPKLRPCSYGLSKLIKELLIRLCLKQDMNSSPLDSPREEAVEAQLWCNHSTQDVFGIALRETDANRRVRKEMGRSDIWQQWRVFSQKGWKENSWFSKMSCCVSDYGMVDQTRRDNPSVQSEKKAWRDLRGWTKMNISTLSFNWV